MSDPQTVTQLLHALRDQPEALVDRLTPHLYDDLRRIARRRLQAFRPGDTLRTTALVHEAYLRLVDATALSVEDRLHFLAVAARVMRFVLVDYARERGALKRGGEAVHLRLDDEGGLDVGIEDRSAELLALDEALERLAALNPRLAQVVEYRYFGGLTIEETAAAMGVSDRTVKRDWTKALLWLRRALQPEA